MRSLDASSPTASRRPRRARARCALELGTRSSRREHAQGRRARSARASPRATSTRPASRTVSSAPFAGDAFALSGALRALNPAPFACVLCAARRDARRQLARALPARRRRPLGREPADQGHAAAGRRRARRPRAARASSPRPTKDRAENLMIVDLVRNDLGRVCEIGQRRTCRSCSRSSPTRPFTSWSRPCAAGSRPGCDALDAVRAAFPPGSMTGAPKLAAMQLLGAPRARAARPLRRARSATSTCAAARPLASRSAASCCAAGAPSCTRGGGVVADSEPAAEWRETRGQGARAARRARGAQRARRARSATGRTARPGCRARSTRGRRFQT